MDIAQLMSVPALTCHPHESLNDAAQLMWEHDCGALPVVDHDGSLVGMITDRDVCMAAYTQGLRLDDIPVSSAMANQVFSCTADQSLTDAEHLMSEKQVRRVPIIDGHNRPVGLLSLNDVARYAASARKRNGLDREVTQTLAAVGAPRRMHGESEQSERATQSSPAQQHAAQQPTAR